MSRSSVEARRSCRPGVRLRLRTTRCSRGGPEVAFDGKGAKTRDRAFACACTPRISAGRRPARWDVPRHLPRCASRLAAHGDRAVLGPDVGPAGGTRVSYEGFGRSIVPGVAHGGGLPSRGTGFVRDTGRQFTGCRRAGPRAGTSSRARHLTALRTQAGTGPPTAASCSFRSSRLRERRCYTDNEVLAIEVKSRDSEWSDLERGVYQCVKYRAVLAAQERQGRTVRALLVIESELPRELAGRAKRLDITHRSCPPDGR